MTLSLPEDILHVICDVLYRREDLSTLFNIALASKHLAPLALGCLYRMQRSAGRGDDEGVGNDANALLGLQKWSIAWRSIILSALDHTIFPYYRYLRVLDLQDFFWLLDDPRFGTRVSKVFFEGEMSRFNFATSGKTREGVKRRDLDRKAIVEAVGDVLAPRTPMVEQLTGPISSEAFARWIGSLPRLRNLKLWHGEPLVDNGNHQAIYWTCPNLDSLSLYGWRDSRADKQLGKFIAGLPAQSLRSFVTQGEAGISVNTCTALNRHSESLTELKLSFGIEGIASMNCLQGISSLETLKLEIPSSIDLEASQNDVYNELTTWLGQCTKLRSLELVNFKSSGGLLTPLMLNGSARIEELYVSGSGFGSAAYMMKDNRTFHQALSKQQHLRDLDLYGDAEDCTGDDIDALVESLSQIKSLKKLKLRGVSDYFPDSSTVALLASLPQLEDVYVSGLATSDDVLAVLPLLSNLRSITLAGFNSTFTSYGLQTLAKSLSSGNEGIYVNVMFADPAEMVAEEELKIVQDALMENVGGRLEYQATRDPDVSEFDSESD